MHWLLEGWEGSKGRSLSAAPSFYLRLQHFNARFAGEFDSGGTGASYFGLVNSNR